MAAEVLRSEYTGCDTGKYKCGVIKDGTWAWHRKPKLSLRDIKTLTDMKLCLGVTKTTESSI